MPVVPRVLLDHVEQDVAQTGKLDAGVGGNCALAPRTAAKSPQLVGLLREMFLRNDPASYADACRALAKAPAIRREGIGQRTLLLVGDHDRSTPIAMTEELHREIPVSLVRVIPGASHWATLEQPDALAAAILEFLT